ncbi:MAG TPA: nucleoside kinase [Lachnospiraceae bacterium]|nr:nucleoside kinase [Lachnospiraceae bacterium]
MEKKIFQVTVDEQVREYEAGTTYRMIAEEFQKDYDARIVLAMVDKKLNELQKPVTKDCSITFKTVKDRTGYKTYRRSACLLLIKAIHDVVGEEKLDKIKIEFSVSKGYYVNAYGDFQINQEFLDTIKARMDEMVAADIPITKQSFALDDALKMFSDRGMKDKERLFRYRRASKVNVYGLEDFEDYYYGYMLPSTGYIDCYELFLYDTGFVIQMPVRKIPGVIPPFEPQPKLFATMKEATLWGDKLGIDTVGALNDKICEGNFNELILVQEALQESKIADIAADIAERGGKKFVMIAGPSSSGKTTFSHRLSIQLRAHGLIPHPIAVDDYFVNRELTPRDENGEFNFECLEAIDVEDFNKDMSALLAGETVELPSFNFKTGLREYKGNFKTLGPDDILVIEGIHGLNDKLSYALPAESKYKIYISALTSLNVDEHNRIATTDGRLIRRMVRDARTRGASAHKTLSMWQSVRRGEEENIFPFQESADAMFNSALIYELAVLKQFAEPLLFSVGKDDPEYQEAKRLLKFLEYFLGVSSENLPNNSILREFVGGSCFNV